MNDTVPRSYEKENINNIVSVENNTNYTFEISDDNKEKRDNQEFILNKNTVNPQRVNEKDCNGGEIIVTSILECEENEYLKGVKINLYKINGLSPVLVKSKVTDEEGKVIFSGIEEGCYRIIEIVDKRYFEKPKYINWNEIIIDDTNKKQKIVVVNKIKRLMAQNKYKN
ncbi:prealbumin-like fold domain-containing protein [Clostridium beijerinckii]|uniref:prealbumin-like fold domain-containing protein n=1 Tax=Clostridium beijerinckii TaxID=1520 RepID=UPI00047DAEAB|nr:prealbumin-like fold domain-containing protein [Clostridium beijerinckii]